MRTFKIIYTIKGRIFLTVSIMYFFAKLICDCPFFAQLHIK